MQIHETWSRLTVYACVCTLICFKQIFLCENIRYKYNIIYVDDNNVQYIIVLVRNTRQGGGLYTYIVLRLFVDILLRFSYDRFGFSFECDRY
jgi:hypothetical protein